MTNKITSQRIALDELVLLVMSALLFTAINVVYSTQYGRLALPPTYDDIGYISNAFTLLDAGYQHGWRQWLLDVFTKTWHAPVTVLQACLAFAVFGKALWAPYLFNGLYLIVLLICLRRELVFISMPTFAAIAVSILAWPLTGHLIVEFRPDIPTNLFLALGTWRLAKRHEEIGQGQYGQLRSASELAWPFLVALWLKPSFSPVIVGLWLSAWALLCGVNHFVLKSEGALRNTLVSFGGAALFLFMGFLPYLAVSGTHLARYFSANIFSDAQDLWSLPLSIVDNLKYYVIGGGGWATMRLWPVVTTAAAVLALVIGMRSRDHRAVRTGAIYAAMAFVAWGGMTVLRNKSPWFGSVVSSHFLGIFIMTSGYIIQGLRKIPAARHSPIAVLVLLGVGLHAWPARVLPGLSHGEMPAFSREAKRVFTDTCNAIQDHSGGTKVSILMPAISLMANPNLVELCWIERNIVPTVAPRIYMQPYNQVLRTIQSSVESGEDNMLALILSPDFPGIPGSMPTSKHLGSINYLFSSSSQFELTGVIRGPNETGQIRVFKKIAAFSPIENVIGMKGFEGPYPDLRLPIVRWALFPATEFDLRVTRGHRTRLTLAGRPPAAGIPATVRLSTGDDKNCMFDAGVFTECRFDFSAQTDLVHVKIEPHGLGPTGTSPIAGEAILLSRIEVLDLEKIALKDPPMRESAFSRIDFLDGFGDMEGPYKKWELPVVIWGRGSFSTIGIAGPRGGSSTLLIEWRPGATVTAIEVLHRETLIGRCVSGGPSNEFRHCRLELPSAAISGDLTLRYTGDSQILSGKMNNSALFKRIQLIEKTG